MSELFQSEEKDGMHIVTLPSVIDSKNTPQLESAMKFWIKNRCQMHLMDMKNVSTFMPSAYRPFVQFCSDLKAQDKIMVSINIPDKIMPNLIDNGVKAVFNVLPSMDHARRMLQDKIKAQSKSKVNVQLINPFIESTLHFMKEQANLEVEALKPILKHPGEYSKFQIAGHMLIKSPKLEGSIVLGFQRIVFEKLYAEIMREANVGSQTQEEIDQSAGEILNIVLGRAKVALQEKSQIELEQSFPEILIGDSYKIHEKISAIIVPFKSSIGSFYLEIGFML